MQIMKKLLLSIIAAGSIAVANAQAGSWLVYGNVGYNSMTDAAKTKTNTLNFNPGVGYQFNTMWTAGVAVQMTNTSSTPDGGSAAKDNTLGLGVFGRYTKPVNNIFSLYAQLDIASITRNTDDGLGTPTSTVKYTGLWINLAPAVSVHIPGWFEMNFSFGGLSNTTSKSDAPGANTASTLDFTFGKTVNIGISKNFGMKKMHGHHEPGDDTRHMNTKDDDDDAPKATKHKKGKKEKKDDDD
jgi:hypothetical protein